MAGSISDSEQRRRELAAFLRARRSRLRPELVGIHADAARRRVRGLRREEVAHLSKVSYSWYTRLEQGKDVHATAEVIDSIANALQLTDDELRHLRRLAALPLGPRDGGDVEVDEDVRRLLERMLPAPPTSWARVRNISPGTMRWWPSSAISVSCRPSTEARFGRSLPFREFVHRWWTGKNTRVSSSVSSAPRPPLTPTTLDSQAVPVNWPGSVPSFATGGPDMRWSEVPAGSRLSSIRTSACCPHSSYNFG